MTADADLKPPGGGDRGNHVGGGLRFTMMTWLILIALIAVIYRLFLLGALWGILGLSVLKHVVVAYLCQSLGVDRDTPATLQIAAHHPPHYPRHLQTPTTPPSASLE